MTIIMGGGNNPPVRLDPFQNIVNVGWGSPGLYGIMLVHGWWSPDGMVPFPHNMECTALCKMPAISPYYFMGAAIGWNEDWIARWAVPGIVSRIGTPPNTMSLKEWFDQIGELLPPVVRETFYDTKAVGSSQGPKITEVYDIWPGAPNWQILVFNLSYIASKVSPSNNVQTILAGGYDSSISLDPSVALRVKFDWRVWHCKQGFAYPEWLGFDETVVLQPLTDDDYEVVPPIRREYTFGVTGAQYFGNGYIDVGQLNFNPKTGEGVMS